MGITVRNLSSLPLTLDFIERYEAPSAEKFPPGGGIGRITSGVGNLLSGGKKKGGKVNEGAKSFKKDDVNVRIEPFSTQKTQIQEDSRKDKNDIVRLTFKGDGGATFRIDVPTSSGNAERLQVLNGNPPKTLFGLYFDNTDFLAIFEGSDLAKWMGKYPDNTPLDALSIPGTHNAPTHHNALPSVRCQAVSPVEQLQNGVRFFDMRVKVTKPNDDNCDELEMVHSVFPISLSGAKHFKDLYQQVLHFLKENPSETIILSFKREGTGDAQDHDLAEVLNKHYVNDREWFDKGYIPNLGEARGKIVLMRRFKMGEQIKKQKEHGWGINAEGWADNTPNNLSFDVQVQDFYEVLETENIEKKTKFVCEHCNRAGQEKQRNNEGQNHGPLFINFLSGSNFWKPGCWPDKVANKINPAVTQYLAEKHHEGNGHGSTGVLVCDWVGEDGDWDLNKAIVGMNAKLLVRR